MTDGERISSASFVGFDVASQDRKRLADRIDSAIDEAVKAERKRLTKESDEAVRDAVTEQHWQRVNEQNNEPYGTY